MENNIKEINKRRKMTKLGIVLLIAGICVAPVFAPAATEQAAATKTIKLGTSRADDHPTTLGAKEFARIVEEKTGGRYKVEVYPNDMLGNDAEMFAQLKTGDLEMCIEGQHIAFISV
jgi:TRAP-type C4-dicarboxylate transport system substrate-binding protein